MTRHPAPGLFVVLEGPSGVGKSTLTHLVTAQLTEAGRSALATTEPTNSGIGDLARHGTREYDGLALACLVAADRYHHLHTTIRPALAAGKIVVCDRYVLSSLVLQAADNVPEDFIRALNQYADAPDLTIVLVGDPATSRRRAATRGTYSRFHEGGEPAGSAEQDRYLTLARRLPDDGLTTAVIDIADRPAADVASQIVALVPPQPATPS